MNFDVISMKQRAKGLMRTVKPNPLLGGVFVVAFGIIMVIIGGCIGNVKGVVPSLIYPLVWLILHTLFMTSLKWFCLKATREEAMVGSDILLGFKEKQGKVLVVAIVKGLCIYLFMMLFVVGALLPFYWFRFAENIVKDDDTMNPIKALGKSMKYMKGHYIELIKIDLSLIGWWILYVFTCGIAGIYVLPYTSMLYAEFYDYIKGQYEAFNAN